MTAGRDGPRDRVRRQMPKKFASARQRPAHWGERFEDFAVARAHALNDIGRYLFAEFLGQFANQQGAAHTDPPVNAPGRNDKARLIERRLPGQDMLIDIVDEGAVEIEDEIV